MSRLIGIRSGVALTGLILFFWQESNPQGLNLQDNEPTLEKIESNKDIVHRLRFNGATLQVGYDVVPYDPSLGEKLRSLSGSDRVKHEILSMKETVAWDFETDVTLNVGGKVLEPGVYRALPWILPTGGIEVVLLQGRKRWVFPARCHRLPVESEYLSCSLTPKTPSGFRMNIQWGRDLAILGFGR